MEHHDLVDLSQVKYEMMKFSPFFIVAVCLHGLLSALSIDSKRDVNNIGVLNHRLRKSTVHYATMI